MALVGLRSAQEEEEQEEEEVEEGVDVGMTEAADIEVEFPGGQVGTPKRCRLCNGTITCTTIDGEESQPCYPAAFAVRGPVAQWREWRQSLYYPGP